MLQQAKKAKFIAGGRIGLRQEAKRYVHHHHHVNPTSKCSIRQPWDDAGSRRWFISRRVNGDVRANPSKRDGQSSNFWRTRPLHAKMIDKREEKGGPRVTSFLLGQIDLGNNHSYESRTLGVVVVIAPRRPAKAVWYIANHCGS